MIVLAVVLNGSNIQTIANPIRAVPQIVAFTQLSISTPKFPDRIVA
jgi:hypothetical protein